MLATASADATPRGTRVVLNEGLGLARLNALTVLFQVNLVRYDLSAARPA